MQISDIKRRVVETIERARRQSAERRSRHDDAAREYEAFLEQFAVPIFKQVSNVLRAEGFFFTVFTPGGSVRLIALIFAEGLHAVQTHYAKLFEDSAPFPPTRGKLVFPPASGDRETFADHDGSPCDPPVGQVGNWSMSFGQVTNLSPVGPQ